MASALPSPALAKVWNSDENPATLATVLAWAKVSGPLEAAFLAAVDTTSDEPYKSLTLLSEEEAASMTEAMKIGDNPLGPLQAAKVRLVFAAMWHAASGGTPTEAATAKAGPPLPDYPLPATLTTDMPDVVSLNGLVMQTGNILTRLIPQAEYDEMFRTYRKRCGAVMSQEVEPTSARASAYLALVKERGTIAVDFAVWKPNADRNEQNACYGRFTLYP